MAKPQECEVALKRFTLMPPSPDMCPVCACNHPPEFPHNARSLYYQTKFFMERDRAATWADAMAHCEPEMQQVWTEELRKRGESVPG